MSWADYGYPDNPDISTPYRALLPIWEAAVEREIIIPSYYNLEVGCDIWTNERGKELWYPEIPIDNTEAFNTRYRISADHMNSWLIRWATRIDDMMFQNYASGAGDNIFGRFVRKDATKALNDDGTLNRDALILDLNDLEELLGEKVVMAYDYIGAESIVPWLLQRYRIFNELYILQSSPDPRVYSYFNVDQHQQYFDTPEEAWSKAITGKWVDVTSSQMNAFCDYSISKHGEKTYSAGFSATGSAYLSAPSIAKKILQVDLFLKRRESSYPEYKIDYWHPWLPEGVTRLYNPEIKENEFGHKVIDYNICSKDIPEMPSLPSQTFSRSYSGYYFKDSRAFYIPDYEYMPSVVDLSAQIKRR